MSIIPFTGRIGELIGYQRNGKYFLRGMPETVRQTNATRRAARRFGIASRKGALIRSAFRDMLDVPCDSGHINRLNKVLIAAREDHAAMRGFRFNQLTGTDRFFTIAPVVSRNEVLRIPPQNIAGHKGITSLEVKVIAARIDFNAQLVTGAETVTFIIDPAAGFEGSEVMLNVPGKGTLVVTLQVRGIHNDNVSCNRQYLTADIIAVLPPQMPVSSDRQVYHSQAVIQPQLPSELIYASSYYSFVRRE